MLSTMMGVGVLHDSVRGFLCFTFCLFLDGWKGLFHIFGLYIKKNMASPKNQIGSFGSTILRWFSRFKGSLWKSDLVVWLDQLGDRFLVKPVNPMVLTWLAWWTPATHTSRHGYSIPPYQVHIFHHVTLCPQGIHSNPINLNINGLRYQKDCIW